MPAETFPAAPAATRRALRARQDALAPSATPPVSGAPVPSLVTPVPTPDAVDAPARVTGSRRAAREAAASKLAAAVLATATVPFDTRSLIVDRVSLPEVLPAAPEAFPAASEAVEAPGAVLEPAADPVQSPAAEPAPRTDVFTATTRLIEASAPAEEAAPADALPPAAARQPGAATAHLAPRRSVFRRVVAVGATAGVMGVVGMLAVSMTVPTGAVAAATGAQPSSAMAFVAKAANSSAIEIADDEIQAFVAPATVTNEPLQRSESFSSISLVELAGELGIRYSNSLYTNDPSAKIQWPFAVGVAMSSPYGMRDGTMHEGIDLVPGEGAPIQAIADGTVRLATESGGNYGVTVYIDHLIDGQLITSHYSHMQYGSLQVKTGDVVTVGTTLGKTGNTGRSYGAHLHFELIVNGATIDPLPWMQEHAGRH